MAGLASWTRALLKPVLAARRCPACSRPVTSPDHPAGLCPDCAKELAPRTGGFCPRCGKPFGLATYEPETCGDCLADPPPWERLAFHGPYDGRLRELILSFKFSQGLGRTRLLQDLVKDAALRAGFEPDLVVPVPLHPRRLRWRGYNQSLELAGPAARALDAPVLASALERVRDTVPQSKLSGAERLSNLAGAFKADPEAVAEKRVLLVDDVSTTGSTLRECCKALGAARTKAVDVLVLAVA